MSRNRSIAKRMGGEHTRTPKAGDKSYAKVLFSPDEMASFESLMNEVDDVGVGGKFITPRRGADAEDAPTSSFFRDWCTGLNAVVLVVLVVTAIVAVDFSRSYFPDRATAAGPRGARVDTTLEAAAVAVPRRARSRRTSLAPGAKPTPRGTRRPKAGATRCSPRGRGPGTWWRRRVAKKRRRKRTRKTFLKRRRGGDAETRRTRSRRLRFRRRPRTPRRTPRRATRGNPPPSGSGTPPGGRSRSPRTSRTRSRRWTRTSLVRRRRRRRGAREKSAAAERRRARRADAAEASAADAAEATSREARHEAAETDAERRARHVKEDEERRARHEKEDRERAEKHAMEDELRELRAAASEPAKDREPFSFGEAEATTSVGALVADDATNDSASDADPIMDPDDPARVSGAHGGDGGDDDAPPDETEVSDATVSDATVPDDVEPFPGRSADDAPGPFVRRPRTTTRSRRTRRRREETRVRR